MMHKKTFFLMGLMLSFLPGVWPSSVQADAARDCETVFDCGRLLERLQDQTILIVNGHKQGSGVVVKRGDHTFVWTAAHVVAGAFDSPAVTLAVRVPATATARKLIAAAHMATRCTPWNASIGCVRRPMAT